MKFRARRFKCMYVCKWAVSRFWNVKQLHEVKNFPLYGLEILTQWRFLVENLQGKSTIVLGRGGGCERQHHRWVISLEIAPLYLLAKRSLLRLRGRGGREDIKTKAIFFLIVPDQLISAGPRQHIRSGLRPRRDPWPYFYSIQTSTRL